MKIKWKISSFEQLSARELYHILQLRQQVFIIEQQCIYQDCDGQDLKAHHLMGYPDSGNQQEPMAYLRLFFPDEEHQYSRIGRLLIHPTFRNNGLARDIMTRSLAYIEENYPEHPVTISAQQYLVSFYQSLNFKISSDSYDEDGIPHIQMTRSPQKRF